MRKDDVDDPPKSHLDTAPHTGGPYDAVAGVAVNDVVDDVEDDVANERRHDDRMISDEWRKTRRIAKRW